MRTVPRLHEVRTAAAILSLAALAISCGGGGGGGGGGNGGGGGGTDTQGSAAISQDRASVTPSPVVAARQSPPGAFAADYLRGTSFTSLVVEIDYPVGKAPSPEAVSLLEARLAERCDKPDGIVVNVDDAIATSEFPDPVSVDDLARLEAAHRDTFSNLATKTAAMYVLYVPGSSDLDEPQSGSVILGLAYAGSSIGFFIDNANPGRTTLVTRQEIEGTGIVHECGHLLGLVDGGCPMVVDHEDDEHRGHCNVPTCVMFWQVSIDPQSRIIDLSFAEFDPHCAADMAAFGGLPVSPLSVRPSVIPGPFPPIHVGDCGVGILAWRRLRDAGFARSTR
jgi:hypothetical protein